MYTPREDDRSIGLQIYLYTIIENLSKQSLLVGQFTFHGLFNTQRPRCPHDAPVHAQSLQSTIVESIPYMALKPNSLVTKGCSSNDTSIQHCSILAIYSPTCFKSSRRSRQNNSDRQLSMSTYRRPEIPASSSRRLHHSILCHSYWP